MRAIFISYRREDAEGEAGRLFDDLTEAFGENAVFMDVAAIEIGRDFRKAIDESVSNCGVLLAIIGRGWVDARNEHGKRRLDNPSDFVRYETVAALKRDIPVIPVLVHGARMPHAEQLPEDLQELAYRNGIELRGPSWRSDVQILIKALRPYVDGGRGEPTPALEPSFPPVDSNRANVIPAPVPSPLPIPLPAPELTSEPAPIPAPTPVPASIFDENRGQKLWPKRWAQFAVVVVAVGAIAYLLMQSSKKVAVPDFTGVPIADAERTLHALKLAVGQSTKEDDSTAKPGTVLRQNPMPGTRVSSGAAVSLVIAQRPRLAMVDPPAQSIPRAGEEARLGAASNANVSAAAVNHTNRQIEQGIPSFAGTWEAFSLFINGATRTPDKGQRYTITQSGTSVHMSGFGEDIDRTISSAGTITYKAYYIEGDPNEVREADANLLTTTTFRLEDGILFKERRYKTLKDNKGRIKGEIRVVTIKFRRVLP